MVPKNSSALGSCVGIVCAASGIPVLETKTQISSCAFRIAYAARSIPRMQAASGQVNRIAKIDRAQSPMQG